MKIPYSLILIFLFCFFSVIIAQQKFEEKELVEKAFSGNVDSLLDKYAGGFTKLGMKSTEEDSRLKLFESVFLQKCAARSVNVQTENPERLFIFTGCETDTSYAVKKSVETGLNDFLERTIILTVSGWLEDYGQNQKTVLQISQKITDLFKQEQMVDDKNPFNADAENSNGTWKVIIEPMVVIASVTVIIYLFFSQRS